MYYLNLDPKFDPFNSSFFGGVIDYEVFDFPSGCEPHIKIRMPFNIEADTEVTITTRIKSMNDLMILLLATDALKRLEFQHIDLFIPFLPFARQDRVMVEGEPFSLKIIAEIINSQGYDEVMLYDVHSEVAPALIDNSVVVTNHKFVSGLLDEVGNNYVICCPDAGAYKKIFKLCKEIGYEGELVLCNKVRDLKTGNILKAEVNGGSSIKGRDVYIIDDICDGGGTFSMLAKALRKKQPKSVNLIVTHGIMSKGTYIEGIDEIWVTDSFKNIDDFESNNNVNFNQVKLIYGETL